MNEYTDNNEFAQYVRQAANPTPKNAALKYLDDIIICVQRKKNGLTAGSWVIWIPGIFFPFPQLHQIF